MEDRPRLGAPQAHNLKVIGSNPIPATKKCRRVRGLGGIFLLLTACESRRVNSVSTKCMSPGVFELPSSRLRIWGSEVRILPGAPEFNELAHLTGRPVIAG